MSVSNTEEHPYFVQMPFGIFTAAGVWYHTTREDIEEFVNGLLDVIPLERLIEGADVWMRASQILTLCLFPFLLLLFPTTFAAVLGLGFYIVLKIFAPVLANYRLTRLLKIFDHIALQFVLYMVTLTLLAWWPDRLAVVAGLSAFVLLRLRVFDVVLGPGFDWLSSQIYRLPVADQTFRAILLKAARSAKIDLPEVRNMENRMISNLLRSKPGKKR